jgi:hypothetical protein
MWKETVMVQFEILLWHLRRGFDEKYKGPHLGHSTCHQDSTNHLLNTSWKLYSFSFHCRVDTSQDINMSLSKLWLSGQPSSGSEPNSITYDSLLFPRFL